MHVVHGNSREECPKRPCDRPRCPRPERATTREEGPFDPFGLQRNTGKRAIGPSRQAVHRKQDERAKDGENGIGRPGAQCALIPARVAEGIESGRKRGGNHLSAINRRNDVLAMRWDGAGCWCWCWCWLLVAGAGVGCAVRSCQRPATSDQQPVPSSPSPSTIVLQ